MLTWPGRRREYGFMSSRRITLTRRRVIDLMRVGRSLCC
jgi:hypothetical protein